MYLPIYCMKQKSGIKKSLIFQDREDRARKRKLEKVK